MHFASVLTLLTIFVMHSEGGAISFGKPTFFGSGCPEGTVSVRSYGQVLSLRFSKYSASTSRTDTYNRKSCSLALPVDIAPGYAVAIAQSEFSGYVRVPNNERSEARFQAEYFFAGGKGNVVKNEFEQGTRKRFRVDHPVAALAWSGCGQNSTIFRANTALSAKKRSADESDVHIELSRGQMVRYEFITRACDSF